MHALSSDTSLSLKDKFSQHWERKKESMVANNSKYFNILAPLFLHSVLQGATPWVMLVIFPSKYADSWSAFLAAEAFTVYGYVQVMVNWICLWRSVANYNPDVHGTEPPNAHLRAAVRESVEYNNVYAANGLTHKNNGVSETDKEADPPDGKSGKGDTCTVYFSTNVTSEGVSRQAVPYWSWVQCLACKRPRPPRCHHCTLCGHCVLKRDHHCFFGRNCVNFNNQRFFIYFLVWSVILTGWGTIHMPAYIYTEIMPHYSYWDLLWPVGLARVVFGYLPLTYLHLMNVAMGAFLLLLISGSMLCVASYLVYYGITSFEQDHKIKVCDTRPLGERIRSVMGQNWGLSLILPGYTYSAPQDDPVYWPHIKVS